MRRRFLLLVFLFAQLWVIGPLSAQQRSSPCSNCKEWNTLQKPFRIFANSYYVGTHGLGSVLITSETGHVLIDGALPESAQQIMDNIRSLGFRVEDLKLIVNSHAHFDHAGGIAELQKVSGARVAASPWTANVFRTGAVQRDDPQFGIIEPIAAVARVEVVKDNETLHAGGVSLTAHFTPGHTPGGTSWVWLSCEKGRCLYLVYADSLSPVSSPGFRFSRSKETLDGFERSLSFLETTPCDILITPHPEVSKLWQRLAQRDSNPDAMIDANSCRALATGFREALKKRLDTERAN